MQMMYGAKLRPNTFACRYIFQLTSQEYYGYSQNLASLYKLKIIHIYWVIRRTAQKGKKCLVVCDFFKSSLDYTFLPVNFPQFSK